MSAAGTTFSMDIAAMERLIRDAGFAPMLRDTAYRVLGPYRRPAAREAQEQAIPHPATLTASSHPAHPATPVN